LLACSSAALSCSDAALLLRYSALSCRAARLESYNHAYFSKSTPFLRNLAFRFTAVPTTSVQRPFAKTARRQT
jgi:hypothetical protein